MSAENPIIYQILNEQNQGHKTRINLFTALEKELGGIPVVSFYTSFRFDVMIEDTDVEMIESVLQKMDLTKGLALLINSPGGLGLAAERIINICRSHSKTGEFVAIVPGRAKSAATMICMGASKIYMSPTSELGPIDPQIQIGQDKPAVALWNIVRSYKELFEAATKATGNIEPYLQQLSNYDAREIKQYEVALELSEDVAVRALKSGMMSGVSEANIKKKINAFLTPDKTKSHGRSIFHKEAIKCGLNIELMDLNSKLWEYAYELYVRTHNYTVTTAAKCIESKDFSLAAGGTE